MNEYWINEYENSFKGHCSVFDILFAGVNENFAGIEGGKSKSNGLKWQQYPSKWTSSLLLLLLISYNYTNVGH